MINCRLASIPCLELSFSTIPPLSFRITCTFPLGRSNIPKEIQPSASRSASIVISFLAPASWEGGADGRKTYGDVLMVKEDFIGSLLGNIGCPDCISFSMIGQFAIRATNGVSETAVGYRFDPLGGIANKGIFFLF